MEKTYNAALIRRVQEYMEKHSISQNQLAAKVNLSSAALSSYLNQKYKGSVEAVERQLTEFFKINDEVAAVAEKVGGLLPREPYVPTSISEDVYQSIRFAQLEHCMVVLHGDAGVGKSKGDQKFLKDHPTNAVGISITPSTGTLSSCIKLLARALRVDKLTLAALEATLQAYADGTALQEIPVLSMLAQTPEELHQQAESLCRRMGGIGVTTEVVSTENPVGGGAVPTQTLPSFAVAVAPRDSAAALEAQLRQRPVPIIVRIAHDRCLLDMRALFPADLDEILQAFREIAS